MSDGLHWDVGVVARSPVDVSRQDHFRTRRTRRVFQLHQNQRLHITPQSRFTMALLVDKHRPRNLEALSYHPELSDRLRALVSSAHGQLVIAVI
jgi:hypothetical protein